MPGSLSEWELWACAAHVETHHGDHAPLHVAEQIGRLALAGDESGVAAWQAIARRLVAMNRDCYQGYATRDDLSAPEQHVRELN